MRICLFVKRDVARVRSAGMMQKSAQTRDARLSDGTWLPSSRAAWEGDLDSDKVRHLLDGDILVDVTVG
jgi:hypothetical protein